MTTEYEYHGLYIPMEDWGKDHLTTLLYLETRCVDHRGIIDGRNMRGKSPQYPTRLRDDMIVSMHSDWDCVDDMIMEGMVVRLDDPNNDRFMLTDKGWGLAWTLRRRRAENWKSEGGFNDTLPTV